jgi:hypothetical protein
VHAPSSEYHHGEASSAVSLTDSSILLLLGVMFELSCGPWRLAQVRFPVAHSTTLVWNGLFDQAMHDGAAYFLTCHDDTEFYPMTGKYWSDVLVASLAENVLWPNLGVAGPLDMRNPKVRLTRWKEAR